MIERELAVTRGKLSESEELHRRESAALEERIQILEKQNNDLLAQIANYKIKVPAPKPVEASDSKQQDNSLGLLWNRANLKSSTKAILQPPNNFSLKSPRLLEVVKTFMPI